MAYLGWGVYVMRASTAIPPSRRRRECGGPSWRQGHLVWTSAYPSGFQPYRNSHFNIPEWVRRL